MIKIQSLSNIIGLEEIRLRAGFEGADSLIRWPYIAEGNDIGDWINGGELIFVTGQNWQWQVEDFIYLINIAKQKHASGLVILTQSPYISSIPEAVLALANKDAFPVFEQPYSLPMVKVTELLSNAIIKADLSNQSTRWLMYQLMESVSPPSEITLIRAAELGIDVNSTLSVAVIVPDLSHGPELDFYQYLLNQFLSEHQSKFPLLEYHQGWLLLLPFGADSDKQVLQKWQSLCSLLKEHGCNCSIGLSKSNGLEQFSDATSQAKQSADFAAYQGDNALVHFQDLGIHQLFASIEERNKLKIFCEQNLGELYGRSDKQTILLKDTLLCYFEQLGSSRQTSLTLGIHRNTLTHRLKRIEELSGINLSNAQQRLCIQNALVMEKLTLAKPNKTTS
jgi:sugar diacid utilization regulator